MGKYFLTTAIVYVNAKPHIGYAYELVTSDITARFRRMKGDDVFFSTGSDEHSGNVYDKAKEMGKDPKEYCDELAKIYKDLWVKYNISNDDYIQTTEERHKDTVRALFQKAYDNGDIYKGNYEGWYCKNCESYYTESDLNEEGNCPVHGLKPDLLKEENYFLKLSKYADQLLKHIEDNPDFIQPATRKNEVVAMIKGGLKDVSVSRPGMEWGIKLPVDESQTVYVWFDALINYISVLDYDNGNGEKFKKYWPADLHVIGKDITKFHCIIWPIMLMSAGIELPKKVFGHGWLMNKGEKISKTRGNIIDPGNVADQFGVDAIRYYLASHITNGSDGDFTEESIVTNFNTHLANDLGNLINRSLNMIEKYFEGNVPDYKKETEDDKMKAAVDEVNALYEKYDTKMDALNFSEALSDTWSCINTANKLIEDEAPWTLAKEGNTDKLGSVMKVLYEIIRVASIAVAPVMPSTSPKIWEKLGVTYDPVNIELEEEIRFKSEGAGVKVTKGDPLFPRIVEEKN